MTQTTRERWHGDQEYDEHPIEKVTRSGDGYELVRDGWTLHIPDPGFEPTPGQMARYYGRGMGYGVRGVLIDGRCVYYRTAAEQRQKEEDYVAGERRKKEAEFERDRESRDARIAALPPEFQARLQRFRDGSPDFRIEYEPYELFCCEQAVAIATALGDEATFWRFHGLPPADQVRLVPTLSAEHSGNTFGMACRLAYWYLTKPEDVTKEHGALAPIVGCEAYGCTHPA